MDSDMEKFDLDEVENDINRRINRSLPPKRLSAKVKKAFLAQRELRWTHFCEVAQEILFFIELDAQQKPLRVTACSSKTG